MSEDRHMHELEDGGEDADDVEQTWAEQVEHEETVAPEAVNEEVEEYVEVDGVVEDSVIGPSSVLYPNEEVSTDHEMENGSEAYHADENKAEEDLSMNLPDLLSRTVVFTNGSKMFLCFSKRCRKQLAFEGHLYNIDGLVKPASWNLWRCANQVCGGTVRTSPNITELRIREPHCGSCRPDEDQIRVRIAVYDLRLMAEFTDLPLDSLYHAYLDKLLNEHSEIMHIFPPYDALRASLEDHRTNLTYRRRFATEARKTNTDALPKMHDMPKLQIQSVPSYRLTKPFPKTLCMKCDVEFRSTPNIPAHDQLLEHMFYDHNRKRSVVSRFTFDNTGLFEHWIRELQYHSLYRLKKMCIHDEHMYYLCQNDVRHFKASRQCRTDTDLYCTAFVRVHDWRLVIQGEASDVVVDYCLDHCHHKDDCFDDAPVRQSLDYFTPEVFMWDLAAKRGRTQQIIQGRRHQLIRSRPPIKSGSLSAETSVEPACTQSQQNNMGPDYDVSGDCDQLTEWADHEEYNSNTQPVQQRQKVVGPVNELKPILMPAARSFPAAKDFQSYRTKRAGFADAEAYESVLQIERNCDMLIERMQHARSKQVANRYLEKITRVLDDAIADPGCAPPSAVESLSVRNATNCMSFDSPTSANKSLPSTTSQAHVIERKPHDLSEGGTSEKAASLPLRQKVLLRRGENGQIIVVKRTILGKVRKMEAGIDNSKKGPIEERLTREPSGSGVMNRESGRHATEASEQGQPSQMDYDGPPIGEVLRDALYVRKRQRVAAESQSGPNANADEEARRFVRNIMDASASPTSSACVPRLQVRKMEAGIDINTKKCPVEELLMQEPAGSSVMDRETERHATEASKRGQPSRRVYDGRPIGEVLRDALYMRKRQRFHSPLQGFRCVATEPHSGPNENVVEEARQFVRNILDTSASPTSRVCVPRLQDVNVAPRLQECSRDSAFTSC